MLNKSASFLEIPEFNHTTLSIQEQTHRLIEDSQTLLQNIGSTSDEELTFKNIVLALDELRHREVLVMSAIHLLQNVSPEESIRKAAEDAEIVYQKWAVEKSYDPGVYQALSRLAAKIQKNEHPPLTPEEKKLLDEELLDRKRLGLHLPQDTQTTLKQLQKKLAQIETEFSNAINDYEDELWVAEDRLKDLKPEQRSSFLKNEKGECRVRLQYPEYLPVMEFCSDELIRKDLLLKKYRTAPGNQKRLQEMVDLRHQIANLLGYASWNDYVLEDRMAKTPRQVVSFLNDLETKLRVKADKELDELRTLKAQHSSESFELWDYLYYSTLRKKQQFSIDYQALKSLFPLQNVLQGLFRTIETLFDLTIVEKYRGTFSTWHDDVQLFLVYEGQNLDRSTLDTSHALGAFYLDAFPRPGKYGHAAAFSIVDGKRLADGRYQRPVSAMVCNFSKDIPTLSHGDVETLFHEFGHILHGILTWAPYSKFSGTSVAWDFVEAPSQILENWAWSYDILQTLVPAEKKSEMTPDLVNRLNAAHQAGLGLFYLRQVSFAKADLAIHGETIPSNACGTMDQVLSETFLPVPADTYFGAGFGHMTGYASGYYGYAWADVMAADMFSLFKGANLLNPDLGRKLRREIYEVGSVRDEADSLRSFLGRELRPDAFLQSIGLETV